MKDAGGGGKSSPSLPQSTVYQPAASQLESAKPKKEFEQVAKNAEKNDEKVASKEAESVDSLDDELNAQKKDSNAFCDWMNSENGQATSYLLVGRCIPPSSLGETVGEICQ